MNEFIDSEFTIQNIKLRPYQLHQNFIDELLFNLTRKIENQCTPKFGYVKKGSIRIVNKTLGQIKGSNFDSNFSFDVTFRCLSIRPQVGQKLVCIVTEKNEGGLRAIVKDNRTALPYLILVPQNLDEHSFKTIKAINIRDEMEVEVLAYQLTPSNRRNAQSKYCIIGRYLQSKYATNEPNVPLMSLSGLNLTLGFKVQDVEPEKWKVRNTYTISNIYEQLREAKDGIGAYSKYTYPVQAGNSLPIWDQIKRLINPYETATSSSKKGQFETVSKLSHDGCIISRAFYKMHEIIRYQDDCFNTIRNKNMRILNMAESPGGFTQAIIYNRNYLVNNHADDYVMISKMENNYIKGAKLWDKFKCLTKRGQLHEGYDFSDRVVVVSEDELHTEKRETLKEGPIVKMVDDAHGDLTDLNNINFLLKKLEFGTNKADLITADGGQDSSGKFNNQEMDHYRLFFCEIAIALATQAEGGTFVLKVYDMLTDFTVHLLVLLSLNYQQINIFKPLTSRQANSEKYIVCTHFTGSTNLEAIIEKMFTMIQTWDENTADKILTDFLLVGFDDSANPDFIDSIKRYNTSFAEIQMNNINQGIERLKEVIAEHNVDKSKSLLNIVRNHAKRFISDHNAKSREFLISMGLPVTESTTDDEND